LRAGRLGRTLSEIEPGRPGVAPPLVGVADQSDILSFKKVSMTRTRRNIQAQVQSEDPRRRAKRQRRNVEVRRVAVVHPGGSHFKLLAVRAPVAATRG
jgi:hypothetical protein